MKYIGVIPARWASTRFEGKVLAEILGKPMIQHVWERAKKSSLLDEVYIACDEEIVFKKVQEFGAQGIMTSSAHQSGTDRIAEAVKDLSAEIVVNIQGDEPLIHHDVIDNLVKSLLEDISDVMATVVRVIEHEEDLHNSNIVKVVLDNKQKALYFSRSCVPYNREKLDFSQVKYFKHLGIYAYRKDFLCNFKKLPDSFLEQIEKLEQLRVLEAGYKIKTIITQYDTVGVDTSQDLKRVEALMQQEQNYA